MGMTVSINTYVDVQSPLLQGGVEYIDQIQCISIPTLIIWI